MKNQNEDNNEHENDERPCDCGGCRSCRARLISENDTDDTVCPRCGGAGCGNCEGY